MAIARRGMTWMVALAGASLGSVAGCGSWINDEHCLFHRGDRACDGQICVVLVGGGVVPDARDGCVDELAAGEVLSTNEAVHLRHGLPIARLADGSITGSDTVQEVLQRTLDERGLRGECSVAQGLPLEFEDSPDVDTMLAARARLEGLRDERKGRIEQAFLVDNEARAVVRFNDAVEAWAQGCEPVPAETTSTTSTTSTSGTSDETTGDGACSSDEDCSGPLTPFCHPDGSCVSCDGLDDPDAACASVDPLLPVCHEGTCVQCSSSNYTVCQIDSHVCDAQANVCVPCTAHEQCGEAACDLFEGACFPNETVVHVGPSEIYTSISAGVASLDIGARGTIIIEPDTYFESVVVDNGLRVALLASDAGRPSWDYSGSPQLTVEGTAFVDGLDIAGNSSTSGVFVDGGLVWIDRAQIVQNDVGIQAMNGATLVLRNSTVGHILVGADYSAVQLYDSQASIIASTLVGDELGTRDLYCNGASSVTVRNSIVVNYPGSSIPCSQAEISYSATSNLFFGTENVTVGGWSSGWFVDWIAGDFHLDTIGILDFADVAQWQTGDPTTDLDGDPRPSTNGARDYAGADTIGPRPPG